MNKEIRNNISGDNYDVLICRRMECFFQPNPDGSPSTAGKVIMHTEWWHYAGTTLRATSMGPQIRNDISELIGGEYAGIPGDHLLVSLKEMFLSQGENYGAVHEIPAAVGEVEPNEAG